MMTDEAWQEHLLKGVSRTFALTIPQLPAGLSRVVGNAYLLCRIADTIEDDRDMSVAHKRQYSDIFIDVVNGDTEPAEFSAGLLPLLSTTVSDDERELVEQTATVIRITHSFNSRQQKALSRCIRIMADGMARFQEANTQQGLANQEEMDQYCYYVAGVVGEMLTELFCDYSPEINRHYDELMSLSVSFGQGLQMTNILKDIWDDRARNMCWLPRDIFRQYGTDLTELASDDISDSMLQALGHLIGITRVHLENALHYSLLIPGHEKGIRRFCLWAIGMAILTLRNINHHRNFKSGREVKINRSNVRSVVITANLFTRHDRVLRWLFEHYTAELPRENQDMSITPAAGTRRS